jgi:glycosyltransferase involved in cell wall biosynthesis
MRVALIVPGGVGRDGVHLVIPALLDLIGELALRHDVQVAALEQGREPAGYELRGARVCCLGQAPLPTRLARLLGALRPFRPDVLHSFWLGSTSTLAALAGLRLGAPLVASLGGGELVGLPQIGYGGQLSARGRLHAALAARAARAVTAGSRYALAPLRRRRPDAHWLPLGARTPPGAGVERPAGPPWRLLHVASINRVKGPLLLLDAIAVARDQLRARTGHAEPLTLDWAGQDVLDGEAQRRALALGLDKAVRFHGWLPHSAAQALCAEAHLYVQASFHESQGVAVCEAAAAGVPTVGTAVGLVAELAPHGAVAVPPGDAQALGLAIAAALTEPGRREALGRSAQRWARAHDAAWTVSQLERIYRGLREGAIAPPQEEPWPTA